MSTHRALPPLLAVSLGCPAGIGPEVSLAAAAAEPSLRCLLVGDLEVVHRAADAAGLPRDRLRIVRDPAAAAGLPAELIGVWGPSAPLGSTLTPGRPDAAAGAAQLAWIDQALALVQQGVAEALVTGPVSKKAVSTSGVPGSASFRGHTEYLAERLGSDEVVMAFASERLVTALCTTHLPLRQVPDALRPELVARTAYWLSRLLVDLGKANPRVVVAALNPHAGEGGLLGTEEGLVLSPGLELARQRLSSDGVPATLQGPLGAESAFRLHADGHFDGVVAMYHDQATVPMKLLGFGEAVNVSLGLPIIRTSVDHGTGYDVAWQGRAEAQGMRSALRLGFRLALNRRR